MKVGTAATEIDIEDCPPDAWNLLDYLSCVSKNLCSTITVDKLWDHVNWSNQNDSQVLYVVKTLVDSIPVLTSYSKLISDCVCLPPIAIHRITEQRQTTLQLLGMNSEREIGFTAGGADKTALDEYPKYLAPTALSNCDTLCNKITTPETWNAKDKALKAIAQEHFSPSTSTNPSSLSKLYQLSSFKRPSNLKQCDHYPTVRGLEVIWVAQIFDCWRIVLGVDELQSFFDELSKKNDMPTLEFLLSQGSILIQKEKELQVKTGTPWVSSSVSNPFKEQMKHGVPADSMDSEVFDSNYGDIGTVMQQLTIWTLMFCSSTHQQYVAYLLELHCLLEYESSPALRTAILNNYLVKFGLACQEKDLMQEHHNGKLELMVEKVWESALELKHRSYSHTSPSSQPKLCVLLMELKATELHLFRSGRPYPAHIATDLLSFGYNQLGTEGKLQAVIKKTEARAKFISAIKKERRHLNQSLHEVNATVPPTINSDSVHSPLSPSDTSESESESIPGTELDDEKMESSKEEAGSDGKHTRVEVNIAEGSDEDSQAELDIPASDEDDDSDSSTSSNEITDFFD
ncbi:hypothetical protein K435DRAFT_851125 [Dendrothele bispora CBS 962.96]|uniref:DUF6589 domain-containing protein n=1 Tax=Dendrothele bispora (strain CBS 962.96) TaxID=1314807 RepID=A0A4S8MN49_DENBC|nr:hypothetical protein K435DRAFT_851125 [Dendrothele bispora CBS 962.96]